MSTTSTTSSGTRSGVGPDLWERFTVKDPADHRWYYGSLRTALHGKIPDPLADELRRTVDTLDELASEGPGWG